MKVLVTGTSQGIGRAIAKCFLNNGHQVYGIDRNHFKAAMQTRNKELVDRADFVVFNVDHASGGAYQTLKYAKKNEVPYINISEKGAELGL